MNESAEISIAHEPAHTLVLAIIGHWRIENPQPSPQQVQKRLQAAGAVRTLVFDARDLGGWDSSLLAYILKIQAICEQHHIQMDPSGLPQGIQRLLQLAAASSSSKKGLSHQEQPSFFYSLGVDTLKVVASTGAILHFIGDAILATLRLLRGVARFRRSDLALFIEQCGAQALPIVTLISVLVGIILAFVGAVQLKMFGAQIYVANLVGLAMAREMGAMMSAIIMAGRTGSAFAAQLGTMMVNEEIDALRTLGVPPMDFLVLPRMLALVLMLPLLCVYANLMGILGGALVGVGLLDISLVEYLGQTRAAVGLIDFATGIIKSIVFGVLIAVAGCLRGLQCERSASAVGDAATSAVVMAIVLIVVSDAIFTFIFNALGI